MKCKVIAGLGVQWCRAEYVKWREPEEGANAGVTFLTLLALVSKPGRFVPWVWRTVSKTVLGTEGKCDW